MYKPLSNIIIRIFKIQAKQQVKKMSKNEILYEVINRKISIQNRDFEDLKHLLFLNITIQKIDKMKGYIFEKEVRELQKIFN